MIAQEKKAAAADQAHEQWSRLVGKRPYWPS